MTINVYKIKLKIDESMVRRAFLPFFADAGYRLRPQAKYPRFFPKNNSLYTATSLYRHN